MKQEGSAMSASSPLRTFAAAGVVAIAAVLAISAYAQQASTDGENGRYSFAQTSDGSFLRLDTRTGRVSTCSKRDAAGWACYAVPDERSAFDEEIGRLQADNTRLKDELKKRDIADAGSKTDTQLPKGDLQKKSDSAEAGKTDTEKGNRIELQLPNDQDVDRVVSFLERAWRRLVEAANRMQRDVSGKI
jgi:hypothetical protein